MAFGDLAKALAMLAVSLDGEVIQYQRISADLTVFKPGAPHAGAHPLDYQAAFQLGDAADDYDDGRAQRPSSIDALPEADELDADSVQFVQHFKKMALNERCDRTPRSSPHRTDRSGRQPSWHRVLAV